MKKTLLALSILFGLNAAAQTDTTKVKALALQVRLIEYLTPVIVNTDNDSLLQVWVNLRPTFRVANPPVGVTLVTIDSIPTVELANLYNYTLSNSDGMGVSNMMKTQISATRLANTYLDRLCTGFETMWTQKLIALRLAGRKLLRGK